jgi:hypothetical protein
MFSSFTGSFKFGRRHKILPTQAASVSDYRSLLSAGGQAAYDSAEEGDFFYVSAEDYATVFEAIDGAFKLGMTDSQLVDDPQSTFVRTFSTTLPEAEATVPVGTLLFGFISEHASGSMQHLPRLSPVYKGNASSSYVNIANAPLVSSTNGLSHHLRKPPFVATETVTYMALFSGSAGNGNWRSHGTTNTWPGGGYTSGGSWTNWNNSLPKFQMAGVTE